MLRPAVGQQANAMLRFKLSCERMQLVDELDDAPDVEAPDAQRPECARHLWQK